MAPYINSPPSTSPSEQQEAKTAKLQQIHCKGPPYEIGHKHGSSAPTQIARTISFYTRMFQQTSSMEWERVKSVAMDFAPVIRGKWPGFWEEMRGVEMADIVACNVRTEIAFGLFSDGCTALSWREEGGSWLAQNWDWEVGQKENLIVLTIEQADMPTIKMVTEAGLIGKIGLNSAGVGVCLNAIRVKGMDPTKLPCHLGLRMALESGSREEAVRRLEEYGIASACHMLVADATGGVGLEWSSTDLQKCEMNDMQQVFHSNHYLETHSGLDSNWLADSQFRVKRIEELAKGIEGAPTREKLFEVFKDETNYPGSICRAQKPPLSTSESLFNIIMDLAARRADVSLGRPVEAEEHVVLAF